MTPTGHRRVAVGVALVLAAGGVMSCQRSDANEAANSSSSATATVHLVVRDGNIREAGVPCSGAAPFLHIHRSAAFAIEDDAGATLTRGRMPSGTSVPAFEEDLEVVRIPTFCEFTFDVDVADRPAYFLLLDGESPIPLTPGGDESHTLLAVVP